MRCGRWLGGGLMVLGLLTTMSGCVTLSEHHRLQAQHRNVLAEKATLEQDLFDLRTANDSLRTRVGSIESELATKSELLANLRKENTLLDEMRKTATDTLEEMAGKQTLGQIAIAGPRLPEALDTALKQFASQHPNAVDYDAARGTVKWRSDLLFAVGSDVVRESSIEALRSFTQIIMSPAASDFELLVVGHTDSQPIVRADTKIKHPTNWHLSAHRAIAVAFSLQKYGYEPGRMGIVGYGEYRPIADNTSAEGKSQNRRVEIYLVPRGAIVEASASAGRDVRAGAMAAGQP